MRISSDTYIIDLFWVATGDSVTLIILSVISLILLQDDAEFKGTGF